MKKGAYDIALAGILGALIFAVQVAMAPIPNVELVTLLIVISTILLEKKVFYVVAVFVVLEIIFYPSGMWSIVYLYIWNILAIVAYFLREQRSALLWAFVCGTYGLLFGLLSSFVTLFAGGIGAAISYFAAGLLFDVIHGVSNFVLALVLFRPLSKIALRFKR